MALITLALGVALMALTLALPHHSPTAWIPFGFGIAFLPLGALADRPALRKHVMHLAAGLALLGLMGAGFRAVSSTVNMVQGADVNHVALASTAAMASLCAVFLVLCVRSFVTARRRQAQHRAEEEVHV